MSRIFKYSNAYRIHNFNIFTSTAIFCFVVLVLFGSKFLLLPAILRQPTIFNLPNFYYYFWLIAFIITHGLFIISYHSLLQYILPPESILTATKNIIYKLLAFRTIVAVFIFYVLIVLASYFGNHHITIVNWAYDNGISDLSDLTYQNRSLPPIITKNINLLSIIDALASHKLEIILITIGAIIDFIFLKRGNCYAFWVLLGTMYYKAHCVVLLLFLGKANIHYLSMAALLHYLVIPILIIVFFLHLVFLSRRLLVKVKSYSYFRNMRIGYGQWGVNQTFLLLIFFFSLFLVITTIFMCSVHYCPIRIQEVRLSNSQNTLTYFLGKLGSVIGLRSKIAFDPWRVFILGYILLAEFPILIFLAIFLMVLSSEYLMKGNLPGKPQGEYLLRCKHILIQIVSENPLQLLIGSTLSYIWLLLPINYVIFNISAMSVEVIQFMIIINAAIMSIVLWMAPLFSNIIHLDSVYFHIYRDRLRRKMTGTFRHLVLVGIGDMGHSFLRGYMRSKIETKTLFYMFLPDGKIVDIFPEVICIDRSKEKMVYEVAIGNILIGLVRLKLYEPREIYVMGVIGSADSATVREFSHIEQASTIVALISDINSSLEMFDLLDELKEHSVAGIISTQSSFNVAYFTYKILEGGIRAFLLHPLYLRALVTSGVAYSYCIKSIYSLKTFPINIMIIGRGSQIIYFLDSFLKLWPENDTDANLAMLIDFCVLTDDELFTGKHNIENKKVTINRNVSRKSGLLKSMKMDVEIISSSPVDFGNIEKAILDKSPHLIVISDQDVRSQIREIRTVNTCLRRKASIEGKRDLQVPMVIIDGETGIYERAQNIGDACFALAPRFEVNNGDQRLSSIHDWLYPSRFGLASQDTIIGDMIVDIMADPSDRIESIVSSLEKERSTSIELNICANDKSGTLAWVACKLAGLSPTCSGISNFEDTPSFLMSRASFHGDSQFCFQAIACLENNDISMFWPENTNNRILKTLVIPLGTTQFENQHEYDNLVELIKKVNLLTQMENENKFKTESLDSEALFDFIKDKCPGCSFCTLEAFHTHLFSQASLLNSGSSEILGYPLDQIPNNKKSAKERLVLRRQQRKQIQEAAYRIHHGVKFEPKRKLRDPLAKLVVCCSDADIPGSFATVLCNLLGYKTNPAKEVDNDSVVDLSYLADYQCHDDRYMSLVAYGNLRKLKSEEILRRSRFSTDYFPIKRIFIRPSNEVERWERYARKLEGFLKGMKLSPVTFSKNKVAFVLSRPGWEYCGYPSLSERHCPMRKTDFFSYASDYRNSVIRKV